MDKHQSKSITPIDIYKFLLSKEIEDQAKNEIRETESVRQHAIQAMRDFVQKNPRIEMARLDGKFLLRFLRFRKFSVPMAVEALERWLVVKSGNYGRTWFENLDVERPSILKLIDTGFVFLLPERDYMGRRVIFYRSGVVDPMCPNIGNDVLTLMTLVYDLILEDEENQIRGVVHVSDAKGIRMPHFTVFSPQYMFRIGKNTEKTLTLRHKAFHVVNVHKSLNFVSEFILSHLNEKLKKRAHIYENFDQFQAVERKHLPKEYGGEVPMRDMIELMKSQLLELRDLHLKYTAMGVRLESYPKQVLDGSVKSLKYRLNSPELYEKLKSQNARDIYGVQGVQGSFRKLEID